MLNQLIQLTACSYISWAKDSSQFNFVPLMEVFYVPGGMIEMYYFARLPLIIIS